MRSGRIELSDDRTGQTVFRICLPRERWELSPRGGQHYATIYWDFNCPGADAVATVWNFGCGGACVYKNSGFDSIGLGQDTTYSPWPTANIYADDRCTQYEAHAGIWADRTWGCTNKAGGQTWNSFYLYDGC